MTDQTIQTVTDPLPCPFCGREPNVDPHPTGLRYGCADTDCPACPNYGDDADRTAHYVYIRVWNTRAALRETPKQEREACAKICDSIAGDDRSWPDKHTRRIAGECAARIRARETTP